MIWYKQRDTDLESLDAAAEAAKKAVRRLDAGADNAPDDDEVVELANEASAKVAAFTEHVEAFEKTSEDKELKDKLRKALQALKDDNKVCFIVCFRNWYCFFFFLSSLSRFCSLD